MNNNKIIRLFSTRIALYFVLVVRVLLPPLIFVHPFVTYVLSLFFDHIDGQIFFENKIKWKYYNTYDKILDFWWYLFIISYLFFHDFKSFPIAMVLLIYRAIGQLTGVLLKNEKLYLFFPNIFEPFSMLSIILNANLAILLIFCTTYSVFIEWFIHFSNKHVISKYIFKSEIKWPK